MPLWRKKKKSEKSDSANVVASQSNPSPGAQIIPKLEPARVKETSTLHDGSVPPDIHFHRDPNDDLADLRIALDRTLTFAGPGMKTSSHYLGINETPKPMLDYPDPAQPLCDICRGINFLDFMNLDFIHHHDSFLDLAESATACPMCAIIYNSIQMRGPFSAFEKSWIRLRSLHSEGKSDDLEPAELETPLDFVAFIEAYYFCLDPEAAPSYKGPRAERSYVQRNENNPVIIVSGKPIALYADTDSEVARLEMIPGRGIKEGGNVDRALDWLQECLSSHDGCRLPIKDEENTTAETPPVLPTRVVDVGSQDGRHTPRLLVTNSKRDHYLTLSYRWGNPTALVCTTQANLASHMKVLDVGKLGKTIQDAITVTRKFGYRYIWIDCLCIIQDSAEDWVREAAKMGDIYQNSLLTLAANGAKDCSDGLFIPRKTTHSARLPFQNHDGRPGGWYYASDRYWCPYDHEYPVPRPRDFDEEVVRGALSTRAWCLQERLFARRIIHYGEDQIHWECMTKIQSEKDTTFTTEPGYKDSTGHLRMDLSLARTSASEPFTNRDNAFRIWYDLVEQYTQRKLSVEPDKLIALSGVADSFGTSVRDVYAAGLWQRDLLAGLLWTSTEFEPDKSEITRGPLHRPNQKRAPTWSWASVNGEIRFLNGSSYDSDEPLIEELHCQVRPAISFAPYGHVPPTHGTVSCLGMVAPFAGMRGFSNEYQAWKARNAKNLDVDCVPDISPEYPDFNFECDKYVLPLVRKKCSRACKHSTGCDRDRMYYALLLHFVGSGPQFEALPGYGDNMPGLECFMRCGLIALHASDLKGVQIQRVVIM